MFYRKEAYGTVTEDLFSFVRKTKVFVSVIKAKDDSFSPVVELSEKMDCLEMHQRFKNMYEVFGR